jgi:hypothetical protein
VVVVVVVVGEVVVVAGGDEGWLTEDIMEGWSLPPLLL